MLSRFFFFEADNEQAAAKLKKGMRMITSARNREAHTAKHHHRRK